MPTRMPLSECPCCKHVLNAAYFFQPGEEAAPEPGDITICINCSAVLIFADDLTIRQMTLAESAAMTPELRAELIQAMAMVLLVNKQQSGRA